MKTINIEAQITMQMANRQILPAALRYQARSPSRSPPKAAGAARPGRADRPAERADRDDRRAPDRAPPPWTRPCDEHADGDTLAHAKHSHDAVIPAMNAVRAAGDKLETIVADDLWPLPTYREMLFIK